MENIIGELKGSQFNNIILSLMREKYEFELILILLIDIAFAFANQSV